MCVWTTKQKKIQLVQSSIDVSVVSLMKAFCLLDMTNCQLWLVIKMAPLGNLRERQDGLCAIWIAIHVCICGDCDLWILQPSVPPIINWRLLHQRTLLWWERSYEVGQGHFPLQARTRCNEFQHLSVQGNIGEEVTNQWDDLCEESWRLHLNHLETFSANRVCAPV